MTIRHEDRSDDIPDGPTTISVRLPKEGTLPTIVLPSNGETRSSRTETNSNTPSARAGASVVTAAPSRSDSLNPDAVRADLQPGMLLGHTYWIEAMVAQGGMGAVYRARHVELGTKHAVKVILPNLANDANLIELFRREAAALRQIRHDAVVVYDGINRDEAGRLFMVMEFVEGPSLADYLHNRPLTIPEASTLLNRLAGGLAAAHGKGIVHRDLSPDNIILSNGEIANSKIIDFGIAKNTLDIGIIIGQSFAGKTRYVSPEQTGLFGGDIDARSDIYSLGLVLVAALIGRPLDMGDSLQSCIEFRKRTPDLAKVPEPARDLIASMLAPNPANRPKSASELVGALVLKRDGKEASGFLVGALLVAISTAVAVGGGTLAYLRLSTPRESAVVSSDQGGNSLSAPSPSSQGRTEDKDKPYPGFPR